MKKINLPIIYIKWKDHCWVSGDIKKLRNIKNATPYLIEEVGFLISEDEEKVVYCMQITEGFDGKRNNVDYEIVTITLKSDIEKLEVLKTDFSNLKKK